MKKGMIGVLVVFLLVFAVSFVMAETEAVCDSDNLDLCLNETTCLDASGGWENDSCIACPQYAPPASNWCENGTVIPAVVDDIGCMGTPTCEEIEEEEEEEENKTEKEKNQTNGFNMVKQRVLNYLGAEQCPASCTCTGSVIKCEVGGVRYMNVVTRSGNIIIQTKSVNASTNVELIKKEDGIYANLTKEKKQIKMELMPDDAFEKAKGPAKVSECNDSNCEVEFDEDGKYQIQIERHSKVLGIFKKKMTVNVEVDAENGDTKIKKPWWAFLAIESQE
jgi:hypothetical protein